MRTSIMMRCPKCAENSQLDNIHLLDHTFKLEWVGLTDEDCKGMSEGEKVIAMWADKTLKEKNNG